MCGRLKRGVAGKGGGAMDTRKKTANAPGRDSQLPPRRRDVCTLKSARILLNIAVQFELIMWNFKLFALWAGVVFSVNMLQGNLKNAD